jgi:hypothetical protein
MQVTEKPRVFSERRHQDSGAPVGRANRRSGRERRLPAVKKLSLSDSEWESYFSSPINPSEKSDYKMDLALEALSKMLSPNGPLGRSESSGPQEPKLP